MPLDITFVNQIEDSVHVPEWVDNLDSFRRWVDEAEELEKYHVCYFRGKLYIDMAREQLYTHNAVKTQIASVLLSYVEKNELGYYFGDGVFLSNVPADLGNNPDGVFVSNRSFASGRVRDVPGDEGGYVELQGTPDLVIEVVSKSSVKKDNEILMQAYWEAGIPEYWLIDARQEPIRFDIMHATQTGYQATKKMKAWTRSAIFKLDFRMTEESDKRGRPRFVLEFRKR